MLIFFFQHANTKTAVNYFISLPSYSRLKVNGKQKKVRQIKNRVEGGKEKRSLEME